MTCQHLRQPVRGTSDERRCCGKPLCCTPVSPIIMYLKRYLRAQGSETGVNLSRASRQGLALATYAYDILPL